MKTSKIVDALHFIDEDLVAEAVTYRPEEKELAGEILQITEASGKETTMNRKGRRTKRTLAIAVLIAVLVLGTLTVAVAAFRGSLSEGLKDLFHISEEQEEELLGREDDFLQIYETEEIYVKEDPTEDALTGEEETTPDGIGSEEHEYVLSETYQGITVSVKETLIDSYFANIVLRVEGFSKEQAEAVEFGRLRLWVEGESLGSMGGHKDVLEDGTIEYTLSYHPSKGNDAGWHLGKDVEVIWENMSVRDETMRKQPIIEHTWHLTWNLKGTDDRQIWELNTILGDSGAVVESIELTEASIRVNYNFPRQTESVDFEDGSTGNEVKDPPLLVGIVLKDGTVHMQVTESGSSGYYGGSKQKYVIERKFTKLFDCNEIESILFLKVNPDDNIPATDNTSIEVDDCYVITLGNDKLQEKTNREKEVTHDNFEFYCNGVVAKWGANENDDHKICYGLRMEYLPEEYCDELELGSYEVYLDGVLVTKNTLEAQEFIPDEWVIIESTPVPRKLWKLTVIPSDMNKTMEDCIEKQLKIIITDLVVRDASGKEDVVVEGRWELRYTIQVYK